MEPLDEPLSLDAHQAQHEAIRRAAMEWAEADYPVLPLRPHDDKRQGAGKAPLIAEWQKQKSVSTEEMAELIDRYPEMNVGLATGSTSGLVGIDRDGQGGEQILMEKSGGDLPTTWAFNTPGGGMRHLYRLPDGFRSRSRSFPVEGKEHEECSLLADGRQTVLPPSIGPNGGIYAWLEGCSPYDMDEATMSPDWLLNLIAAEPGPDEAVLNSLAKKCPAFSLILQEQKQSGISENQWFQCVGLLVAAGKPEAAGAFSALSDKHDERSESRISQMVTEGRAGMTRCTTLGCSEEQIAKCHGNIRRNESDEAINSPGALLRKADSEERSTEWPTDPIYKPYIELLEGTGYRIDPDGTLLFTGGKSDDIKISNCIARVVSEVTRDNGTKSEGWYVLEGVAKGGRPLEQLTVSTKDFPYMNWLTQWGVGAIIFQGRRDHLRTAIQLSSQMAVREQIYSHIGWRQIDGNWVYLHAGGAIGGTGMSVEIDNMLSRYSIPEPSVSPRVAATASLELLKLAPSHVMIPLLATMYLAPLCEPLRAAGLEPNFSTWLYGRTGTMKTSISLVLLGHFGNFGRTNPPASFKDTANALEMKAALAKDTVLLIDDFHPGASGSEAATLAATAQKLLRMYGDRVGRGRMNSSADGFRTEYIPAGMALVTGEEMVNGHSSVARLFAVELQPNDVNTDKLTEAQNLGDLLAEAMRSYIEYLLPQMLRLPETLAERFHVLRIAFREAAHGRLTEAAAWLMLAYEEFLRYLESVGAIAKEEANGLYDEAWYTLTESVTAQSVDIASETPGEKFLVALSEMLASKAIAEDRLNGGLKKTLSYRREIIGWQEGNHICFLPRALYGAVTSWMREKGSNLFAADKTLWKQLDGMGALVIESGERNNRTVKKALPWDKGNRARVLIFLKSALSLKN